MTAKPATIPARVLLACPSCGQRIETALPLVAALCHNSHRAVAMLPVEDANSQPLPENQS